MVRLFVFVRIGTINLDEVSTVFAFHEIVCVSGMYYKFTVKTKEEGIEELPSKIG